MGRKNLVPLVEDIGGEFNERWQGALRESYGNRTTKSAKTNRGIFEPGAEGRAAEVAEKMLGEIDQMARQVDDSKREQDYEMGRRAVIMKAMLGSKRQTVQRDDGFEPGE